MLNATVYNGTGKGQLEVGVRSATSDERWILDNFPDSDRRRYQPGDDNYPKYDCYYVVPKTKEAVALLFEADAVFSSTAYREALRLFVLYWIESR